MIKNQLSSIVFFLHNRFCKIIGIACLLFTFIGTNPAFASNVYAQSTRLSLSLNHVTLKEAFKEIENNSEFIFFYSDNVNVSTIVSVEADNKPIDAIMKQLLEETDYTYSVSDRQVFVKEAAPANTKATQQNKINVSGIVLDSFGDPLLGASIVLKGQTSVGTSADVDGRFSLSVPDGSVLVIKYLGCVPQEVTVKKGMTMPIRITLKEDAQQISEVVVSAFGSTQKKESIVGSIQSVSPGDLRVPSASLSTSFAGRLSGVVAYQRSGEPGANGANFYIRGISTLSGVTSPLIILDGVEISSGDLNTIDPDIIESFSVLKDATATAMYGTRGANGVMIVKTKSGADLEKPVIGFRFEGYVTTPTKLPKFVDGPTYMSLYNEAIYNQGIDEAPYTLEQMNNTRNNVNPYIYPNVDWYDEVFKDYSFNQRANFNIRGGTSKITYFMNLTANHESGMLKNRSADYFSFNNNINLMNYQFQNNIDFHMTKSSTISLHLNVNLRDMTSPSEGTGSLYSSIMDTNPVNFPVMYEPDANLNWIRWGTYILGNSQGASNPVARLTQGYKDTFANTVVANVDFEQKLDFITKGLRFKALASFKNWNQTSVTRSQGYNAYTLESYEQLPDGSYVYNLKGGSTPSKPVLGTSSSNAGDRTFYGQAYVDYSNTFGLHNVNAMVVGHINQYNNNVPGSDLINSLPQRKVGLAARVNYDYDHRYLLEVNAGYNGSENFAPGHRWGFFPSAAIGWNISQESFFEPLRDKINALKIRGSYGLVGNDQITDGSGRVRFIYMAQVNLQGSNAYRTGYGTSTRSLSGPTYSRYQNDNITWEVGEKLDIGISTSLFKCLNIDIDAFQEIRKNIFQQKQSIPNYLGTANTAIYGNLAKVKNWGFDGSVDYSKQINSDWAIQFKGTFTYATNKVLEYDEAPGTRPALSMIGKKLNSLTGYRTNGLYIDWADIANNPASQLGNIIISPGDIKYIDQPDKDGNYDNKISSDDRVYMGYPYVPEIVYGFGPSIQFRNWDFSFFFQGVAHTSFMMSGFHPFGTQYNRNVLQFVADNHWSASNQDINAKYPRLTKYDNNNNTPASDMWLRDGSFLKLKNAEIGYSINKNFRAYINGSNLLTFAPFKYWDPEMGGGSGLQYPTQTAFNIGLQMTFK